LPWLSRFVGFALIGAAIIVAATGAYLALIRVNVLATWADYIDAGPQHVAALITMVASALFAA
jgi:hypothetical protein